MSMAAARNVLVVGGTGDIGSAIGAAFEAEGAHVLCTDRSVLDLAQPGAVDAFLANYAVVPRDIVYAAAVNQPKAFVESELDAIFRAMEVNLGGFLRLVHALAPKMAEHGGGAITGISSLFGFIGRAGRLPYVVSKHGLIGAVRTLAIELSPAGIRVNAVSPGFIDTKLTRRNISAERIEALAKLIPARQLGLPADIADAVTFLHSARARYITGHDLVVDGGFSVGGFLGGI